MSYRKANPEWTLKGIDEPQPYVRLGSGAQRVDLFLHRALDHAGWRFELNNYVEARPSSVSIRDVLTVQRRYAQRQESENQEPTLQVRPAFPGEPPSWSLSFGRTLLLEAEPYTPISTIVAAFPSTGDIADQFEIASHDQNGTLTPDDIGVTQFAGNQEGRAGSPGLELEAPTLYVDFLDRDRDGIPDGGIWVRGVGSWSGATLEHGEFYAAWRQQLDDWLQPKAFPFVPVPGQNVYHLDAVEGSSDPVKIGLIVETGDTVADVRRRLETYRVNGEQVMETGTWNGTEDSALAVGGPPATIGFVATTSDSTDAEDHVFTAAAYVAGGGAAHRFYALVYDDDVNEYSIRIFGTDIGDTTYEFNSWQRQNWTNVPAGFSVYLIGDPDGYTTEATANGVLLNQAERYLGFAVRGVFTFGVLERSADNAYLHVDTRTRVLRFNYDPDTDTTGVLARVWTEFGGDISEANPTVPMSAYHSSGPPESFPFVAGDARAWVDADNQCVVVSYVPGTTADVLWSALERLRGVEVALLPGTQVSNELEHPDFAKPFGIFGESGLLLGGLLRALSDQDGALYLAHESVGHDWHIHGAPRTPPRDPVAAKLVFANADGDATLAVTLPTDMAYAESMSGGQLTYEVVAPLGPSDQNRIEPAYTPFPQPTNQVTTAGVTIGSLRVDAAAAGAAGNNLAVALRFAEDGEAFSVAEETQRRDGILYLVITYTALQATVQDMIDAYSDTNFVLSVATDPGATGAEYLSIQEEVRLSGGSDGVARRNPSAAVTLPIAPRSPLRISLIAYDGEAQNTTLQELADAFSGAVYVNLEGETANLPAANVEIDTSGGGSATDPVSHMLPSSPEGGVDGALLGPIEAGLWPDAPEGPHIEVRYDPDTDTLGDILEALKSYVVRPLYGTSLDAVPEPTGFRRSVHEDLQGLNVGALLRQGDDAALGLFVSVPDADYSWHLRGFERQLAEEEVLARIVIPGDGGDTLEFVLPNDYVLGLPETLNAEDITVTPYAAPAEEELGTAVNQGFRLTQTQNEIGSTISVSSEYGSESFYPDLDGEPDRGKPRYLANAYADLASSSGLLRITRPDGLTRAFADARWASTSGNATVRVTHNTPGTVGNGFEVTFEYSATAPDGTPQARYTSATAMVVSLRGHITNEEVIAAINAARDDNDDQLVTASLVPGLPQGAEQIGSSATVWSTAAVLADGGTVLTAKETNYGRVEAHRTALGGPVAASAVIDVGFTDGSGSDNFKINLVYHETGPSGNGFTVTLTRDTTNATAGNPSVAYTSDTAMTIGVNGNTSMTQIANAINAARRNNVQLIQASPRGVGSQTTTGGSGFASRSRTLAGGATAKRIPLRAEWDAGTGILAIYALPTDTMAQVKAAIEALPAFEVPENPDPELANGLYYLGDDIGVDTITLPADDGDYASYNFANGVGGGDLLNKGKGDPIDFPSFISFSVGGTLKGVTTIQDVVDFINGDMTYSQWVTASVDANAQGTDLFLTKSVDVTGGVAGQPTVDMSLTLAADGIRIVVQDDRPFSDLPTPATYPAEDGDQPFPAANRVASDETALIDRSAISNPFKPTGGANGVEETPLEALVRPDDQAHGPNVEVRYHAGADTLQDIADALALQGIVNVVVVYGTDLTKLPESPPFTRSMFQGGGDGVFLPTKSNLYDAVKAILHPASNPGVTADDPNKELDIGEGGSVTVEDEGSELAGNARVLNLVGAGVTVQNDPNDPDKKVIEIPGASGSLEAGPLLAKQLAGGNLTFTAAGTVVDTTFDYPDSVRLGEVWMITVGEVAMDAAFIFPASKLTTLADIDLSGDTSAKHNDGKLLQLPVSSGADLYIGHNGRSIYAAIDDANIDPTPLTLYRLEGVAGAPGFTPIPQFSADGTDGSWSPVPAAGSAYLRFRTGPDTFSGAVRFMGADGASVFTQFSADGTAWMDDAADGDRYIRFASGASKPADDSSDWSVAVELTRQGKRGWSPVYALEHVSDAIAVQKLVNWTGGTGQKPAIPDADAAYLGSTGYTAIDRAINVRGPQGLRGIPGIGKHGWSPEVGFEDTEDGRRVMKLVDWIGGDPPKPAIPDDPYLGEGGFVALADAMDFSTGPENVTATDRMRFKGVWSSDSAYEQNDLVTLHEDVLQHPEDLFLALRDVPVGWPPWELAPNWRQLTREHILRSRLDDHDRRLAALPLTVTGWTSVRDRLAVRFAASQANTDGEAANKDYSHSDHQWYENQAIIPITEGTYVLLVALEEHLDANHFRYPYGVSTEQGTLYRNGEDWTDDTDNWSNVPEGYRIWNASGAIQNVNGIGATEQATSFELTVPQDTGLTAEQVRDTVAAFIRAAAGSGVIVTHDDDSDRLVIGLQIPDDSITPGKLVADDADQKSAMRARIGAGTSSLTTENVLDAVAQFLREGSNITIAHDDDADTLIISAEASLPDLPGDSSFRDLSTDRDGAVDWRPKEFFYETKRLFAFTGATRSAPEDADPAAVAAIGGIEGTSTIIEAGTWRGWATTLPAGLRRVVRQGGIVKLAGKVTFTRPQGGTFRMFVTDSDRKPISQEIEIAVGTDTVTHAWELDLDEVAIVEEAGPVIVYLTGIGDAQAFVSPESNPAATASISSVGTETAGAASPGGSPYAFYVRPDLTLPTLADQSTIALSDSGDHHISTLLDAVYIAGPVAPYEDLVIEWSAGMEVGVDTDMRLNVSLEYNWDFGNDKVIRQFEPYNLQISAARLGFVPFTQYNRRLTVPLGEVSPGFGPPIVITEADLDGATLTIKLHLIAYQPEQQSANPTRISANLTHLSFPGPPTLTMYQLGAYREASSGARVEKISYQAAGSPSARLSAMTTLQPLAADPVVVEYGSGDPELLEGLNGNAVTLKRGVYALKIDADVNTDGANRTADIRIHSGGSSLQIISITERKGDTWVHADRTVAFNVVEDTEFTLDFHPEVGEWAVRNLELHIYRFDGGTLPSGQAGEGGDNTGTDPGGTKPTILQYDITGEQSVPVGTLAGRSYTYDVSISQADHVGSARIVGFGGATKPADGIGVLELATISDFSHGQGSFQIPDDLSTGLPNEGDTYTLRLEVYSTTDAQTPVAYHDFRITAAAATTTPQRYIGWAAQQTPTELEIVGGEQESTNVLPIPAEPSDGDGWLWFAVPDSLGPPDAAYLDGNTHDILGGFVRLEDGLFAGHIVYASNAEQNPAILGTGDRTLTLEWRD
ncbi:MAG: hypothetical protein OXH68_15330 [Gammaproteobacteria bacterium]|nr:hypothetical protein [Gammaproteobacteria bacterium]